MCIFSYQKDKKRRTSAQDVLLRMERHPVLSWTAQCTCSLWVDVGDSAKINCTWRLHSDCEHITKARSVQKKKPVATTKSLPSDSSSPSTTCCYLLWKLNFQIFQIMIDQSHLGSESVTPPKSTFEISVN